MDLSILIIEPNKKLTLPYSYLPHSYKVTYITSIELGLAKLNRVNPNLVFLSASFSASKSLKFLESLKNSFKLKLIPLIIIVDLSHRLNFVPGTSWGGKIAVLDSFACKKELLSTLNRVLAPHRDL